MNLWQMLIEIIMVRSGQCFYSVVNACVETETCLKRKHVTQPFIFLYGDILPSE